MIAPMPNPELTAAQHQIRKLLERAIDQLPDSLRTVFVMRDVEELSTAEAARLLGTRRTDDKNEAASRSANATGHSR